MNQPKYIRKKISTERKNVYARVFTTNKINIHAVGSRKAKAKQASSTTKEMRSKEMETSRNLELGNVFGAHVSREREEMVK